MWEVGRGVFLGFWERVREVGVGCGGVICNVVVLEVFWGSFGVGIVF